LEDLRNGIVTGRNLLVSIGAFNELVIIQFELLVSSGAPADVAGIGQCSLGLTVLPLSRKSTEVKRSNNHYERFRLLSGDLPTRDRWGKQIGEAEPI